MSEKSDIEIAIEALERVRDFGHVESCTSGAPVYECCCFSESQEEIAEKAIRLLKGGRR